MSLHEPLPLHKAAVHLGVLDGDGRHAAQREEQFEVVIVERLSVEAVDYLRHPGDPVPDLERNGYHGFGAVSRGLVVARDRILGWV